MMYEWGFSMLAFLGMADYTTCTGNVELCRLALITNRSWERGGLGTARSDDRLRVGMS